MAALKIALGGDELASEYFLMCLASRVHTRKDGMVLGHIALNISNIVGLF